jgi:hypothetical protein
MPIIITQPITGKEPRHLRADDVVSEPPQQGAVQRCPSRLVAAAEEERDGVGHNGDSRDAISSDAFRIAAGIAEMKMLDRIEQSDGPGRPPLVIQQTAQLRAQNDSLSFSPAHDGSSLHLNFRVLAALSLGPAYFHATPGRPAGSLLASASRLVGTPAEEGADG